MDTSEGSANETARPRGAELSPGDPRRLGTRVAIVAASPIPPFEQLRAQLALMIGSGRLRPGDRLPTVRGLAEHLELSNGTVARAYRELEYTELIVGRGRRGTFVADQPPNRYSTVERRQRLTTAARVFATTARQLNAEDADAMVAVAAALGADPEGPAPTTR